MATIKQKQQLNSTTTTTLIIYRAKKRQIANYLSRASDISIHDGPGRSIKISKRATTHSTYVHYRSTQPRTAVTAAPIPPPLSYLASDVRIGVGNERRQNIHSHHGPLLAQRYTERIQPARDFHADLSKSGRGKDQAMAQQQQATRNRNAVGEPGNRKT